MFNGGIASASGHVSRANGAVLRSAWGNAPGPRYTQKSASAESAIHIGQRSDHDRALCHSPSAKSFTLFLVRRNREPWLDSGILLRMHAYSATVCRDLGGDALRVGGISDHIHILTTLPRTLSQAQMIEQIKKTSSKWIKNINARYRGFFWQTMESRLQR